jgi:hypothetical protein
MPTEQQKQAQALAALAFTILVGNTLTPKRLAISWRLSPAVTKRTARSRNSIG